MFRILTFAIVLSMTNNLFAVQMVRVLPIFEEDKETFVLLSPGAKQWSTNGANHRFYFRNRPVEAISDFRGQRRWEAPAKAALRVFKERTGYYNFPEITLAHMNAAPFIDFINCDNCHHRLYFLKIGKKPSIDEIMNKSNRAAFEGKPGIAFKYKYFKAEDLLKAMNTNNHKLPGETVNLNSYFMNAFRTIHAKNMFAKAANLPIRVPIKFTSKPNQNAFHKRFVVPVRPTPKRFVVPVRPIPKRFVAPVRPTRLNRLQNRWGNR
jgi:hypothetical protein